MTQSGGTVTNDKDEVTRAGQLDSLGKLGPAGTKCVFVWPNTKVTFGNEWCGKCLQTESRLRHGNTNRATGDSLLRGLKAPRRRWAVSPKPLKGITRVVTEIGAIWGGHLRSSFL